MFRKEMSKKTQNGGEKINLGGVLQHWAHLGPSGSFNRKQPARLGELGGKLLPYFDYKREWEVEGNGFSTLGKHISLKISEKKEKEEENQGRDTSVTFLWPIPWMFFAILHCSSFFDQLVFDFEALNSFYAPLGVHSCFVCLHLYSSTISILFLCFKRVSTDRLSRNLT